MSSGTHIPIKYRDFYDIPRAIVVDYEGDTYFLDSPFDESTDDYCETYNLYKLPTSVRQELDRCDWSMLSGKGTLIGTIPVAKVSFDPSKRKFIDSDVLREALRRK